MMKKFSLPAFMLFGAASLGFSMQPMATEEDLAEVQTDLRNLEAELEAAEARGTSLSSDLRMDVESIRENAIYLKVKMQRHRGDGGSGTGILRDEVQDLERDISELRQAVRESRAGLGDAGTVTVPVGMTFSVQLLDTLGSETSEPGDAFRATTVDPMTLDGAMVVPAGATVQGTVESVARPSSRTDRNSRLVLVFESVSFDGKTYPLSATVVGASEDMETGIRDEAAKIGIGAGIGAILGAVLGGDQGAVIGGVIGGAGAILGTEGKDVVLPRGTVLELRLDRELDLNPVSEP